MAKSSAEKLDTRKRIIEYMGGKCQRCGESRALCLHHMTPEEKDPAYRRLLTWEWADILTELAKCELICANCHTEHHKQFPVVTRRNKPQTPKEPSPTTPKRIRVEYHTVEVREPVNDAMRKEISELKTVISKLKNKIRNIRAGQEEMRIELEQCRSELLLCRLDLRIPPAV